MKTFLIAELGATHEGQWPMVEELVRMCAAAGASACKLQYWSDSVMLARQRCREVDVPRVASQYESVRIPRDWLERFADLCRTRGVESMCTAYLPADVAVVAPHVSRFKIASLEARNQDFLNLHLSYNKPLVISTGAMSSQELRDLLDWRNSNSLDRTDLSLLHCVSLYPCPMESANLGVLREYVLDGFSDHTAWPAMGGSAVLAGATIVEVHVRHPLTTRYNLDYPHSLNAETELPHYYSYMTFCKQLFGDGVKTILPGERALRPDLTCA